MTAATGLQACTTALLVHKPAEPLRFLLEYLQKLSSGADPVLDDAELQTMFSMFDVTKRGHITVEQANQGLKTLLGQQADLTTVKADLRPTDRLQLDVSKFMCYSA